MTALILLLAAVLQTGLGYPRIGQDVAVYDDGTPFYHAGVLDSARVKPLARYDAIYLKSSNVYGSRTGMVTYLRKLNPHLRILAEFPASMVWNNGSPLYSAIWNPAFLFWRKDGTAPCPGLVNFNYTDSAAVDSLASALRRVVVDSGLWDGLYLDNSSADWSWCWSADTTSASCVDYLRAGCASYPDFRVRYAKGVERLHRSLRAAAPPGFWLIANGQRSYAGGVIANYMNGWTLEKFPAYNGGTWTTNLRGWAGNPGYMDWDSVCVQPVYGWIMADLVESRGQWDATNVRHARYALGSSCFGSGQCVIVPDASIRPYNMGDLTWWYDEFSVNLATGKASTSTTYKHWLGTPIGAPRPNAQGVWRRDFENGIVLVNPTPIAQSVTLEQSYRRIKGRSPNDGAVVNTATIPAQDALFLLRRFKP
jgi:hypothetical protein